MANNQINVINPFPSCGGTHEQLGYPQHWPGVAQTSLQINKLMTDNITDNGI